MKCNICDSKIDEQAGDINGYFGISPVSFCVWCMASMRDMVIQMDGFDDIEILQDRIYELKEELEYDEKKENNIFKNGVKNNTKKEK